MRLQVDNEFQQVKIKDLNEMNNVDMFTSSERGGKAFAAEQKIREKHEFPTKCTKTKNCPPPPPPPPLLNSAINMNNIPSEKYGVTLEEIEKKSISNERFRTIFNMLQTEKTKLIHVG